MLDVTFTNARSVEVGDWERYLCDEQVGYERRIRLVTMYGENAQVYITAHQELVDELEAARVKK